jgi:hypothetical protein
MLSVKETRQPKDNYSTYGKESLTHEQKHLNLLSYLIEGMQNSGAVVATV